MTFASEELADHFDMLYRYALAVTHDPELAADTAQDTLVRALERRDGYRGDAPLGHWLIRIAHNLIIDRSRRSRHEFTVDAATIGNSVETKWRQNDYTVDAALVAERAATRAELLDALVRLPFILRSAVVLHDVEGHRVADIAAIHEISLPAAKQRLRRGRMAMVTALASGEERRAATKGVPMQCWDARQHISEYLDHDLDAATAATIEAHLVNCPTCPPLYAGLVGVHDELGQLRDANSVIDPAVEHRLRMLLTERPS